MMIEAAGQIRGKAFGGSRHSLAAMLNSREAFDSSGVKRSSFQVLAGGQTGSAHTQTHQHRGARRVSAKACLTETTRLHTPDQPNSVADLHRIRSLSCATRTVQCFSQDRHS